MSTPLVQKIDTESHLDDDAEAGSRRRRWWHSPSLVTGLALLAAIALCAIAAPLLTHDDPRATNALNVLAPPSGDHLLGTDQLGRDALSRLLYGARADLFIAIAAVIAPFVIGVSLGLIGGYRGGWFDALLGRLVDVVQAFPFYVLVLALVFSLGSGVRSIFVALTIVGWVPYARITRGEVLRVRRQDFVLAADSGGLPARRVILRHILPNVVAQPIVYAMSDVVFVILAIVTLGYVGLGVDAPAPEWGQMIFDGQAQLTTNWWLATVPGLAVVLVGLAMSLIGDGLADRMRAG